MQLFKIVCFLTAFLFTSNVIAQVSVDQLTTSINGTIINSDTNPSAMVSSENGKYWCTYDVIAATDEMRELGNFKLYENNNLILTLTKVPGSDIEITNSGKLVFYDHSEHFKGNLKIPIYSKEGQFLFSKEFKDADQFEFSPSGEMMGVRTTEGLSIISLESGESYLIEKGLQFSFDEGNEFIAVAQPNKILVHQNSSLIKTVQIGIELPRKVIISAKNNHSVAAV